MFKVNNKDTGQWRRSGVFIVNFEHISYLFKVFLLLTLSKQVLPAVFSEDLRRILFVQFFS